MTVSERQIDDTGMRASEGSDPRSTLECIFTKWPRDDGSRLEATAILDALGQSAPPTLGSDGIADYAVRPRGAFQILDEVHNGDETATFLVVDTASGPTSPELYLALLRHKSDGGAPPGWFMESLKANCPSCFGTGLVASDREICRTCGGGGWGLGNASSSRPRPDIVRRRAAGRLKALRGLPKSPVPS